MSLLGFTVLMLITTVITLCAMAINDNKDFRVVYNTTHIRHIQYVHELQHFLFGLDLNSEMEV